MNPENDDSIVVEYGRIPREHLALFQFLCEGHEGLLVIYTLGGDPPLMRLMIARDSYADWELLREELTQTQHFEALQRHEAEQLYPQLVDRM